MYLSQEGYTSICAFRVLTEVSLLLKGIPCFEQNLWLSSAPKMIFSDILSEIQLQKTILKEFSTHSCSPTPIPCWIIQAVKTVKTEFYYCEMAHKYLFWTVRWTRQTFSFFQCIHKSCYCHLAMSWAYHFQEQLCKIKPNKIFYFVHIYINTR